MKNRKTLAFAGLLLLALACTGCDDDEPEGDRPTLANIWPHTDGSTWIYEMEYAYGTAISAADDPDTTLPSMEDLHARLIGALPSTPVFSATVLYTLALDSTITTESGVTAQHLVETIEPLEPVKAAWTVPSGDTGERRLLRLIARGRPDLRGRIAEMLGVETIPAKDVDGVEPPLMLGGYAFAYEDSGYFGYGDFHTDHSWVYLAESLRVGHEFSLQLAVGLADDIWLHGRIWRVADRVFDGVRYDNVVECMYVIDLGIQEGMDENGEFTGMFRPYVYANTYFSPELGPLGGSERLEYDSGEAVGPNWTSNTCRLVESDLPVEE